MNIISAHPRLVTFSIGVVITAVVSTAVGLISPHQAFAFGWGHGFGR